jgi:hypothetical protein
MYSWQLGEAQNVYATVTGDEAFTISSCTCDFYQISDATTLNESEFVASGTVTITGQGTTINIVYAKFTPAEVGNYIAVFSYVVGTGESAVTGKSSQVIEVLNTMT